MVALVGLRLKGKRRTGSTIERQNTRAALIRQSPDPETSLGGPGAKRAPQGIWMCAGAAMMDALRDGLVLRGVDPGSVHQEAFGAAANQDSRSYTVTLQPGGRRLPFQGEPSLLAMLQTAGESLPSDCRNGTCGSCRLQLISGEVRQVIAPEWPLAERELLTCCCVPATDVTLTSTNCPTPLMSALRTLG